jgi:SNF2 family DNA or RNA helicase
MGEEQAKLYEDIKSEYRNDMLRALEDGTFAKSQIQVLQGLTKLRQIANHPSMIDKDYEGESGKFENVIHTLQNVLSRGHKVLVFSQFVKQLEIYRNYFDSEEIRYAYLDGGTQNRGEVVEEFQRNTDIKLFLISLKAGGVGLNLTEADYVFMLDPWWNPAVEQQAIDRTHRIGQKKKVFIYKFITKDTVEEKILALQNRKRSVAESLITTEESFVKSLSAEDIREILN